MTDTGLPAIARATTSSMGFARRMEVTSYMGYSSGHAALDQLAAVDHPALEKALRSWVARHPDDRRFILTNGYDWCYFRVDDAPCHVDALRIEGDNLLIEAPLDYPGGTEYGLSYVWFRGLDATVELLDGRRSFRILKPRQWFERRRDARPAERDRREPRAQREAGEQASRDERQHADEAQEEAGVAHDQLGADPSPDDQPDERRRLHRGGHEPARSFVEQEHLFVEEARQAGEADEGGDDQKGGPDCDRHPEDLEPQHPHILASVPSFACTMT